MPSDLCRLSALEASRLIAARQLSPVELTEAVLDEIDRSDSKIGAFVTVTAEQAREQAREAEQRARHGRRRGVLDGVPHSIKDLEATAGIRTTGGSMWTRDLVPDRDTLVVSRMKESGSPLLGKTNTPQAGYKDMTDNLVVGPTRNPWDLTRTPGGSSGGAAAALAAGMGPLAQGGDGGGSVRIPASLTGVVGVKPSNGLIPKWPNPDWYATLATAGPLARTVSDAAAMLDVLAGPDPRDPLCIDRPPADFLGATSHPVTGLRVAWSPDLGHADVDPAVAAVCERAARRFTELGCHVEEVDVTWGSLAKEIIEPTWRVHMVARFADKAQERPDWIEPTLMRFVNEGRELSALEYRLLLARRAELYDLVRRLFDAYDILLTPTMPMVAWSVENEWEREMFDRLPFLYPFNLTGHPAVSVPCGQSPEGLPVGLQIVAGWHRDTVALAAAARFEELQPWPLFAGGPR